jgi:type I restriction enzyme S subunit
MPQAEYMALTGNQVVLNLSGADNMRHVEPGDYISHLRSFQGGLEYSAYAGKVSAAYTVLTPRKEVDPHYYRFLFKSMQYVQGLQTTTDQMRDGQSIRYGQFALLPLPYPPLQEQRRIAEFLDRETAQIDELIAKQEQLISTLAERWQAELADVVAKSDVGGLRSKLKYHATIQTGLTLGKAVDGESIELPYLRVANVQVGHVDLSEVKTVAVEPDAVRRHSLRAGDVLMTEGGDLDKLGRGALWDGSIEPCLHQNHVFVVRCRPTLQSRWLVYVLDAPDTRQYFLKTAKKTTNLASTNGTVVGGLPIPCPPLETQQDLVQHLDGAKSKYAVLTSNARAVIEALRERRQALISAAVTGQIDVGGAS